MDEEELEAEEWGWEGDSAFPDITPLAAPEVVRFCHSCPPFQTGEKPVQNSAVYSGHQTSL